jgi:hypothetical protein
MVKDNTIPMYWLGGNHLMTALSQLLGEERNNEVLSNYRYTFFPFIFIL